MRHKTMKYLVVLMISLFLFTNCVRTTAKCKKDHKRVDKAKKSGNLKNW
jgi:hypothetical protein